MSFLQLPGLKLVMMLFMMATTIIKCHRGKKAFVVLKLTLDCSNKKCPIIIDQPEDDLDNRAIFLN